MIIQMKKTIGFTLEQFIYHGIYIKLNNWYCEAGDQNTLCLSKNKMPMTYESSIFPLTIKRAIFRWYLFWTDAELSYWKLFNLLMK